MQQFAQSGGWQAEQLTEETCQLTPTLWLHVPARFDFADALLRFQQLVSAAPPELRAFDLLLLRCLEPGPCHVIHGKRLEIRFSEQYLTTEAELCKCKCGKWSVRCENPEVALQCRC